jgi:hypothetical protein
MNTILTDYYPLYIEPQQLNESIGKNNGKLIVKGVIQRANKPNQNERIYPENILKREIDKYMNEIKNRNAMGELDHSDTNVINLKNVSHIITDIQWDGDDVIGTIEILPTPSGDIAKALFLAGIRVGISSRGLGSTQPINGNLVQVQEDFQLVCWDLVSNPSTHGAHLSPIMEGYTGNRKIKLSTYSKINDILTDIIVNI